MVSDSESVPRREKTLKHKTQCKNIVCGKNVGYYSGSAKRYKGWELPGILMLQYMIRSAYEILFDI